jgi:hypothetical protein
MIKRVSKTVGWLALAYIAYATLSPIESRPVVIVNDAQLEHFVAFGLVGLALGIGYPKRLWVLAAVIIGCAFGLEALQLLTPDRHGRVLDATVKAGGGCCGVCISQVGTFILQSKFNRLT